MKNWLPRQWYSCAPWLLLLTPLSGLYRVLHWIRNAAYRHGLLKSTKFKTPVIVVGNITVGGTGKTPLVMHLAKLLQSAGFHPGIVSRGYGGHATYPCHVDATSTAQEVGDEALELFMNTEVPMVVDPNRPRAISTLLQTHSVNVVLSDDGLQHLALKPSFMIGVVDGQRRFGNGFCLPAGPNRESPNRWQDLDLRVCHGEAKDNEWQMHLKPVAFRQVKDAGVDVPLTQFAGKTVHVVTGIGNPDRLMHLLTQLKITIITHFHPDHHHFVASDFEFQDDYAVIMSGKDAVKCQAFAKENWWWLVVKVECDPEIDQAVIQHVAKMNLGKSQ